MLHRIAPNAKWHYIFEYGVLKDERELDAIKELGVELIPYKQILNALIENKAHKIPQ